MSGIFDRLADALVFAVETNPLVVTAKAAYSTAVVAKDVVVGTADVVCTTAVVAKDIAVGTAEVVGTVASGTYKAACVTADVVEEVGGYVVDHGYMIISVVGIVYGLGKCSQAYNSR